MSKPEAPQRDRWEEAAAGAIERADYAADGTGPMRSLEQPHLRRCIAAALRAAYQQGQKDERELLRNRDAAKRFLLKIRHRDNGCWDWTSYLDSKGQDGE